MVTSWVVNLTAIYWMITSWAVITYKNCQRNLFPSLRYKERKKIHAYIHIIFMWILFTTSSRPKIVLLLNRNSDSSSKKQMVRVGCITSFSMGIYQSVDWKVTDPFLFGLSENKSAKNSIEQLTIFTLFFIWLDAHVDAKHWVAIKNRGVWQASKINEAKEKKH